MSLDQLRERQLQRLQSTMRRVYDHVPFYRNKCEAIGITPDALQTLDDLEDFPFTTKEDLRETYPYGMFAVPIDQVARLHASSGTTGKPTVVGYTQSDLETWGDLVARSLRAAGVRPGDRLHNAYGYGLFTGGLGAHYGAERLGCTVIPASGGMTSRQVQLICDLRPRAIMATPTYLLTILDEFDRQGIDARQSSLEIGLLGAEPWTDEMRQEIEDRAGINALDLYGISEVIGPGVAQECVETKDGPHIWEDHFLPEVVDPATDERLPDGSHGELVFTSLTKQAFPIIRYRTRDLTTLLPGTARPAFRRISRIADRSDDMIILRGVNLFPSQIEELILRSPAFAPHYQILLTREGRMDSLTVRVESRDKIGETGRADAARELIHLVKQGIGVSVRVEVVDPQTIDRSDGNKIKRVLDRRQATDASRTKGNS